MSRGNQAPVPLVDRRPAPPTLAARIRALGKTPAQVRAWAEQHDVPLPRHGVDEDAVTAYETAHPATTGARRAAARAEQPARRPVDGYTLTKTRTPSTADAAVVAALTVERDAGEPVDLDTLRKGEPTDPPCLAKCVLAWPHAAPCSPAALSEPADTPTEPPRVIAAAAVALPCGCAKSWGYHGSGCTAVTPATAPEQRAPVAIPIDGPDPVEMAELGGVILWPHPNRFPEASASAAAAPAVEDEDQYDTRLAVDIALADLEALGLRDPSSTRSTHSAPAPAAPVIDIRRALAAARRLGGQGVPLPRLIDYVTAVDASLPTLPAPCVVCGETVTAEHITRTGQPVHGDPRTRTKCWDAYTERKTA